MSIESARKIYPVMMGYFKIQNHCDTEIRRRFVFSFAHNTLGLISPTGRPIQCNTEAKRRAGEGKLSIPHFISKKARQVWFRAYAVNVEHTYPVIHLASDLAATESCDEAIEVIKKKYRLGFITREEHVAMGNSQEQKDIIRDELLNIYGICGIKGDIING